MKKPLVLTLAAILVVGSLFTACSKEENKPQETPAKTLRDEKFQVVGTAGSDNVNIVSSADVSFQFNSSDFEYDVNQSSRTYEIAVSKFSTLEYFSVSKGNIEFSTSTGLPSNTAVNYFAKGSYPFLSDSSSAEDGVQIVYRDKDGTSWFSRTGIQPGNSSFTVVDVISATSYDSDGAVVKANVTCKLFSGDGSSSIELKNCVIILPFLDPFPMP